ncbi:GNAT family N-acetyltransferase [Microbacterium sp. Marseille-Q6965]|uniref:GNAT family N-acetyltransferase n=1 Tax=Microbacterium sp. Marseille-Q6965 TaxID=2965072 RepID=UPI0021B78B57|nr:GNAT family protein [Microbacterium sp. Marseille-Q6965]
MPTIRLVRATPQLLAAAERSHAELATLLDARIPDGWPEFPEAIPHTRAAIHDDPANAEWWMYFFVDERSGDLVGSGGFAGPPTDGVAEVGYEIAPRFRRQGYASAALAELIALAESSPRVNRLAAHTLLSDERSPGVLQANGFRRTGIVHADGQDVAAWARDVPPPTTRVGA